MMTSQPFQGSVPDTFKGSRSMQNLIEIAICSMAKVVVRKTIYKTYGILRQEEEEEKKKNHNKNNSFSASLKRAEKPTRGLCLFE